MQFKSFISLPLSLYHAFYQLWTAIYVNGRKRQGSQVFAFISFTSTVKVEACAWLRIYGNEICGRLPADVGGRWCDSEAANVYGTSN